MTAGELARLFAAERRLDLDLVVCPAAGWARDTEFAATGLPWVPPSPNIPTVDTALVYPGMCLLEGTNVSEGRGTTRPFEIFGAPWLDPSALTDALNGLALPGVSFIPMRFRPMFDKHAGVPCGGALLRVVDRSSFRSFQTGLRVVETVRRLAPLDFQWRNETYEFDDRPAIDLLTGSDRFRVALDAGETCAPRSHATTRPHRRSPPAASRTSSIPTGGRASSRSSERTTRGRPRSSSS